jgi:hypothetical protein
VRVVDRRAFLAAGGAVGAAIEKKLGIKDLAQFTLKT